MSKQWQTVMKPAFVDYLPKLTGKEVHQVMEKVSMLADNPTPDGMVKKHLIHMKGRPYRIRSGKYRIFYTYNNDVVSIYKMDARDDDTYNDSGAPEDPPSSDVLAGLDIDDTTQPRPAPRSTQPDWERPFDPANQVRMLPEPITPALLRQLHIADSYHTRLLLIKDEEQLLACPGIPDEVLLHIDSYMFEQSLEQVMKQPDLVLNDVDDLLRYKDGELLTFLLKLSPEQERYASWSMYATGPTLVKGGPGTGKSTVALYRVRSLLNQLLAAGEKNPKILFTTYTNALIRSSKELLEQLLGPNYQYVEVETSDTIARKVLKACGQEWTYKIETNSELHKKLLSRAITETPFEGNLLQQQAQKQILQRMGIDYLQQEFETVIVARQLASLEDYLKTPRTGRRLRLNATQRTAVWKAYQNWLQMLHGQGIETFALRRVRAAEQVAQCGLPPYDAVVIDEAQDLDPSALRTLIALCKAHNRLFITADANQSIYGSSFSWSDVHEGLRFQGRTNILKANYRSTAEIGEAAQSYLNSGVLESEIIDRHYINNGPMPDARTVLNAHYEAQLLANYFKKASRGLRLAIGSCAVLCPNEAAGRSLAIALENQGLEATYMAGRDLTLTRPGIKIINLKSSKGLEFPIVALAGFTPTNYPVISEDATDEEREEQLTRERRTMFVGMTRAMRALIVIIPQGATTPLLAGFDPQYWNFTRRI